MWKRLSVLLVPIVLFAAQPRRYFAQQPQSPNSPPTTTVVWTRPAWHMWSDGYGWHFWWMFPVMMMLFMMLFICGVVVYFHFSRHSGGPHQSGSTDRQNGHQLFSVGDSGLNAMPEARSEGRVSGKESRDSVWSIALTATVKRSWRAIVQQRQGQCPCLRAALTSAELPKEDL